ncbi:MAG: DoxX family protein [Ketobacteraceae bacterium]|nr:DoxX family protein [Ketobacteraceae bacterium]
MAPVVHFANRLQDLLDKTRHVDFLGPLALRLYLAPIMLAAGFHKFHNFESIVSWFGNAEWGLGLPFPAFMAFIATATEIIGGFALLLGIALRWLAIPLMFTMAVAALTAHWENGWFAIAPSNPDTSTAKVLAEVGFPGAEASLENSREVGKRLDRAKEILKEHGNYRWLTSKGNFVVLNNGIEFSATYFIMLLVLFFTGAGRYLSVDYWIHRKFRQPGNATE